MRLTEFEKHVIKEGLKLVKLQADKEINAANGRSFITIEFIEQTIEDIENKLHINNEVKSNDYHEDN